jgi:hypothetical protein
VALGFVIEFTREGANGNNTMLSIDILEWPGMNQAFLVSFFGTLVLALVAIPYGKRRPVDRKITWGEALVGSTYVFGVLFLAFGVVPHQWIVHADNDLGWRKDKIVYGPFDILKPQPLGGSFNPLTISYEAVRDVIAIVIHVIYIGLMIYLFSWWQKRGELAKASKELETSTYGRPLVKKA